MAYNIKDEMENAIRILAAYETQLDLASIIDEGLSRDAGQALLHDASLLAARYRESLLALKEVFAVSVDDTDTIEEGIVENLHLQFNANL